MPRFATEIAVLLLLAASAQADVLFSNLGPGDSFHPGGNLIGATALGQRRIAVPFQTPPVRQYNFDAFEAPIGGADTAVRVSLYRDDQGQPGQLLATYSQVVSAAMSLRVWSSNEKPLLEGSQRYWVVVPSADVALLLWGSNPTGQLAGGLQNLAGGAWSVLDEDRSTPAYRISVVPAIGACCATLTGTCVIADVTDCDAAGSNFGGSSTVCGVHFCPPAPPRGACCNPSTAACVLTTQDTCVALGAQWQGQQSSCVLLGCPLTLPMGACCRGTSCEVSVTIFCQTSGGRSLGNGTTCTPVGGVNVCCPADFNNSGEVTVQDLFNYLAGFFGGCP